MTLPDPMNLRNRIDSIKKSLSVPEFFRYANHHLKRAGKEFVVLCPFHMEKTPSCFLYEDHFHCYGCGAHGDVIDAHIKIKGSDFRTALEELGRLAGIHQYPRPQCSGGSLGKQKPGKQRRQRHEI